MKNKFVRKLTALLSIMLLISFSLGIFSVSAEEYSSYQEKSDWANSTMVKQKAVYSHKASITGVELGISDFASPNDICVADNKIYILDSTNSRIVVLNNDYSLNRIIDNIIYKGEKIDISSSTGFYVHKDGSFYIADPSAMCVYVINNIGEVVHKILKPNSVIVPDDLEFKANKVIVDIDGYIFVLCDGVYYGAMVFDSNYNFCGFFGANQTKTNALDFLKNLLTNVFQTDIQKEYSQRALPYEFDDFYESNGFIYTATMNTTNNKGQIRKLSNSGVNVLNRNGSSADEFAFGNGETITMIDKTVAVENFCSVAVDENGYIYALDATYGRVFIYDDACNLITAFGGGMGLSEQQGAFLSACELAINGTDILVVDNQTNIITVFSRTEFGSTLYKAINYESDGKYDNAFPLWKEVMSQDAFNQRAYVGYANYYIAKGDYNNALEYAELGLDKELYEQAFEEIRRTFLAENLIWIFVIAFVLIGLVIFFTIRRKKAGPKPEKPIGIFKRVLLSIRHPIDTANYIERIRIERQTKLLNIYTGIAVLIFLIMFVFKVLETTAGGFLYVSFDSNTYNSALVFISTVGLAVLWCIVNWGLCTLFEGKGTFKEIVIVTAFAMIPQILNSIFFVVASHCLVYSESPIIAGVSTISWIVTIVILLVELSIIHDYSFFRAIGMSIATIIGICLAVFMIFLVVTLMQDVFNFMQSVYNEIVYR